MIKRGGTSLLLKTCVWNKDYLSLVSITGRGKDCTPNGLGDTFEDLWFDDLVHTQAIRASFLLVSRILPFWPSSFLFFAQVHTMFKSLCKKTQKNIS
jgi:hypothetical protein